MKRLIKRAVMPVWRLTAPLRRPLARRLDARLDFMISRSLETNMLPPLRHSIHVIERLEHSVNAATHTASALASDVDMMLGSVVREIARIQIRLDLLQEEVSRPSAMTRSSLSLLETGDDGEPIARSAPVERSRVG